MPKALQKSTKVKKFLKLEYYRKRYGYSQQEFADLIRKSKSTYCHKETGRYPIIYDEMILLYDEINRAAKKAGDDKITFDAIFLP